MNRFPMKIKMFQNLGPLAGGLCAGAAFLIWGLSPLYWRLLVAVPPLEIILHRIVWSLALLLPLVWISGQTRDLARIFRRPRMLLLFVTALLVAANWLIYIWAVNNGFVLQASLGYYINPLVNSGNVDIVDTGGRSSRASGPGRQGGFRGPRPCNRPGSRGGGPGHGRAPAAVQHRRPPHPSGHRGAVAVHRPQRHVSAGGAALPRTGGPAYRVNIADDVAQVTTDQRRLEVDIMSRRIEDGINFVQKPFSRQELAVKVAEALGQMEGG